MPEYPSFVNGEFSMNGNPIAKTQKQGDNIVSNYFSSPYEDYLREYTQKAFASALPNISTFLPETVASFNNQVQAFQNQGLRTINQTYDPILKNIQNNIASRFGNLDNSMFMDNLSGIESKRAEAMSLLAQDVQAKQSELINNELQRRYNYMNMLMGVQNNQFNNMLQAVGVSQNNANAGNQYAAQAYNAAYKNYLNNQGSQSGMPYELIGAAAQAAFPQLAFAKPFLSML